MITKDSVEMEYVNVFSLQGKEIYLPIFQRGYSWSEKQVLSLLDDITSCMYEPTKQLYLLDFIWYDEFGKFKLADGQQRLMTLNLLCRCVNDVIVEKQLDVAQVSSFNIKYDADENQKKYEKFLGGNVVAPYKKVYLKLRNYVLESIENIEKIIHVIKNQIFVFLKKTDSVDSAFEIFKQINTGGKPLSKDEIIKTVLTQYSHRYGIKIKGKMKDIKKLISSYHKLITTDWSGNFDNLAIMTFLNSNIISSREDFEKFANYLNTVAKLNELPIYHIISYLNRGQLIDIIYILGIKGVDPETNRNWLEKVLLPLCLLSVVMTMQKTNPGGVIVRLYQEIIQCIKNNQDFNDAQRVLLNFVSDNKEICKISYDLFEEKLGSQELAQNIKKAILIMDIVISNASGTLNVNSVNLEHIYPQKPKIKWEMEGWPVSRAEQLSIIHNIGNQFLLNGVVNKTIKNDYIDKKVVEYKKIMHKDVFLRTKINTIDFERFEREQESYVTERQKLIANEVYEHFPFGKVLITRTYQSQSTE
ncbi:MAG: DUF262 domain-containing protein [Clostridia bacterium]|nr:DUF262 domain-containing protein [Clostridia bacterium]